MGNAEGTSGPEDSVQTARGPSAQFTDLKTVCKTIPHVRNLAKHYGITVTEMTAEMKRQGIIRFTHREDVDWGDLERKYQEAGTMPGLARMLGTTEKITYNELVNRGIQQRRPGHVKGQVKSQAWRDASAEHWDDPEWREQQRQKWLERLPSMRGTGKTSRPEMLLREGLRTARISFTANAPLHGDRYWVDLLIHQKPVVIEADGASHYLRSAREKDAQRDADLRADGYEVVRFTYQEIDADPGVCIRRVTETFGLIPEDSPVFAERHINETFGERTKTLRETDPGHRAQWLENIRAGQRRRREREARAADDDTVGPAWTREDMQSYPEMR
jgi:very-short-patch-repair endonuclease